MKLLFLTNFFPPNDLGGYEQLCAEVAEILRQRGHDVYILTSRYGKPVSPKAESFEVYRYLYLETDINYYQPIHFFLKRKVQEKNNLRYLQESIKSLSPDIIMIWGMWNLSLNLPFWAEKWMPGRVVYYIASYWPIDENPHAAYWELQTNRAFFSKIKHILRIYALKILKEEGYPPKINFYHAYCVSDYVRRTLYEAGKLQESAIVVYNGIDPQEFLRQSKINDNNHDSTLKLLYFGRLIHDKGVHTAIEALGILKQRGLMENIQLTILGSGHPDYEEKLKRMVTQLDIADYIVFIKQVPRDEIPKLIGEFDIFIFTSIWPEPMARSVMEAMATGLLIIGTEVGGQKEMLINGQNALTFYPNDPESLALQLIAAKNDPGLRRRLAREGQKTVISKFTLEHMVNEIESQLFFVLSKNTNS